MDISEKITLVNQTSLESFEVPDKLKIIAKFTEAGIKIFDADFGYAFWKQSGDKNYLLVYRSPNMDYVPRLPRKRGFTFQVERTKKPFMGLIPEEKNPKYDLSPYMQSIVIIPIFYQRYQYGDIVLCYKKHRMFSKEDNSLGIALGNAAAQTITIQQLYYSAQDFKNRLDKTLDAVLIFDARTHKIEYANLGATKLLGYSQKELFKKTIFDIQPEVNRARFQELALPLEKKVIKSLNFETVLRTKNGKNIPVELFKQLTESLAGPKKFLTIVHDLTERKKVEKEALKLLKQKDEFFSVASHELKTPVTTIKGFAQLLAVQAEKLPPKNLYFVGKINNQVDKLTRLINDLLDISRIETGKMKFRRRVFELKQLIEETAQDLKVGIPHHRLILKLKEKFWIFGDMDRIAQVLTNLINNAVKYSPHAKKIIISAVKEGKFARVSVEDYGVGIDKKSEQRIFERFYQQKKTRGEAYPGLGLGLYISSSIIKAHKGRIGARRKKHKGTIFYFNLPFKRWQK